MLQDNTASSPHQGSNKPRKEVVHIPFHGSEILAVDVDGKPHVVLKPALESIGVDPWTQIEKLRTRSWACTSQSLVQLPGDSQRRQIVTCDVRTFLMLLATIDERRVAEAARPLLVAYQSEVADAIEQYWTKGVAVNPRYSPAEQAAVLAALGGVVDAGWLDTKGRQLAGRVLGEEPDYDEQAKPLTVSTYLQQLGLKDAETRKVCGAFGKALKQKYIGAFGAEPPSMVDLVGRHMVPVAQYQERHRPLFDQVWRSLNRSSGGTSRPKRNRK
jgi:hypothetical protein